jgi:hypothetical protein
LSALVITASLLFGSACGDDDGGGNDSPTTEPGSDNLGEGDIERGDDGVGDPREGEAPGGVTPPEDE